MSRPTFWKHGEEYPGKPLLPPKKAVHSTHNLDPLAM